MNRTLQHTHVARRRAAKRKARARRIKNKKLAGLARWNATLRMAGPLGARLLKAERPLLPVQRAVRATFLVDWVNQMSTALTGRAARWLRPTTRGG